VRLGKAVVVRTGALGQGKLGRGQAVGAWLDVAW